MQKRAVNANIEDSQAWEADGLKFTEMCRQEYGGNNCVFAAGFIEGHAVETVYLRWGKDGDEGGMLMLTADELAAIVWVGQGAIWSGLYGQREVREGVGHGTKETA